MTVDVTMRTDLLDSLTVRMATWRAALTAKLNLKSPWDLPNGIKLYEGPSELDGAPIVGIVSGIRIPSRNSKTGPVLQIYIVPATRHPTFAVRTGADVAVCGDCKHRPALGGRCYVQTAFGPGAVYRSRDNYLSVSSSEAATILAGASVRFGAWGDPAAAPLYVWEPIYPVLHTHTGYTHQWKRLGAEWQWLMASVDSEAEYAEAKTAGWRTFRVKEEGDAVLPSEQVCLATSLGIPCGKCGGCNGVHRTPNRADYVIDHHGFQDHRAPQLLLSGLAWKDR